MKKALTLILALCLLLSFSAFAEGKTMTIGDTTFNSENWEETVDPHRTYNGWACIRSWSHGWRRPGRTTAT